MGLVTRTTDFVTLVSSADPDVTAKNGLVGWMPKTKAQVRKGADVVKVRALSNVDLARGFDADGPAQSLAGLAMAGVVSVNGDRDCGDWVSACSYKHAMALGAYIQDISLGVDPSQRQRALYAIGGTAEPSDDDIGDE